MDNVELWCCSPSFKDGKFRNSTFSILNSTFPLRGGSLVPSGFWAQTVATATKKRNAARCESGIFARASDTRAKHPRHRTTSHAAKRTAAPARQSFVRISVMLQSVLYQNPCRRCGRNSRTASPRRCLAYFTYTCNAELPRRSPDQLL